jgi:hypothetical protein
MKIKSNAIEINYELCGKGNCLVLIHGFGDTLTIRRKNYDHLF